MKEESLSRAVEINERLKQLEEEKTTLIDMLPPTEMALEEKYRRGERDKLSYGIFRKLFRKEEDKNIRAKGFEYSLEITNADVLAMFELRRQETEKLKAELEELWNLKKLSRAW